MADPLSLEYRKRHGSGRTSSNSGGGTVTTHRVDQDFPHWRVKTGAVHQEMIDSGESIGASWPRSRLARAALDHPTPRVRWCREQNHATPALQLAVSTQPLTAPALDAGHTWAFDLHQFTVPGPQPGGRGRGPSAAEDFHLAPQIAVTTRDSPVHGTCAPAAAARRLRS